MVELSDVSISRLPRPDNCVDISISYEETEKLRQMELPEEDTKHVIAEMLPDGFFTDTQRMFLYDGQMLRGDQFVVNETFWLFHEKYKHSKSPKNISLDWERWVIAPLRRSSPNLFTDADDEIRFRRIFERAKTIFSTGFVELILEAMLRRYCIMRDPKGAMNPPKWWTCASLAP